MKICLADLIDVETQPHGSSHNVAAALVQLTAMVNTIWTLLMHKANTTNHNFAMNSQAEADGYAAIPSTIDNNLFMHSQPGGENAESTEAENDDAPCMDHVNANENGSASNPPANYDTPCMDHTKEMS